LKLKLWQQTDNGGSFSATEPPSHRVQSSTTASHHHFIAFVSKSHCF
jgi:hypothetical protein